jgi:3-hydroxyacyl-[acyl-carrier-protein] dehydratase
MPTSATVATIKRVVRESLRLGPNEEIPDDAPLAGGRHDLDSLDMLLVVTTLEKEFGIKIMDRTLDRRVFTSITTLAQFIDARRNKVMSDKPAAAELIGRLPHRPPFLFVTNVVELEPAVRGRGEWEVSADAEFLKGHFPGEPLVPGVLIAEALAQLAGIVAFAGVSPPPRARLARVDVKFISPVTAPAIITLRAAKSGEMAPLYMLDVSAEVGGATVASGSITLAMGEPT